jgi:hypothetical protein
VSISPIFYEQLFCTKVFLRSFVCLQFEFVTFGRKDFGAKAALKMLVKLTPSQQIFLNECRFLSYPCFLKSEKRLYL